MAFVPITSNKNRTGNISFKHHMSSRERTELHVTMAAMAFAEHHRAGQKHSKYLIPSQVPSTVETCQEGPHLRNKDNDGEHNVPHKTQKHRSNLYQNIIDNER